MTLRELKTSILNGTLNDDFLILQCDDNTWLANQYVQEIASTKMLEVEINESLIETAVDPLAFLQVAEEKLHVIKTDIFEERSDDYGQFTNTIVICKKIDKKILTEVEEYVVEVSKLLEWHVKAYMNNICTGMDPRVVDWLYEATGGNIYRIENELAKVNLFPKEEQLNFMRALRDDRDSGLYTVNNLTLSDAIVKKDYASIAQQLYYLPDLGRGSVKDVGTDKTEKDYKIDPLAVVNICLQRLKLYLLAAYHKGKNNKGLTYEELGLKKAGQLYYIKKEAAIYTQAELLKKIDFLASIDLKIKHSELELKNNALLDYIIVKMAA